MKAIDLLIKAAQRREEKLQSLKAAIIRNDKNEVFVLAKSLFSELDEGMPEKQVRRELYIDR